MLDPINTRPNPYPGPEPFQDGQALYGRDQEIRDLFDLLMAERIVLLYSPSGAGKTSLIQAALIPALKQARFRVLPPIRVGLEQPMGVVGINRYLLSVLQSLEEGISHKQQLKPSDWSDLDLECYLDRHSASADVEEYVVLIFDQFEEFLTVDPTDREAKEAFFREVGQVLRDRHRWALFAMREEFVAGLDPYLRLVPTRLGTTFRLELLDETAALEAIRKPATDAGVSFKATAARTLVDNLRTVQVQQPDGTPVPALGPCVEPVQLQVVCRRLWDRLAPDDREIDEADVTDVGDVDGALRSYYADSVATVEAKTGVSERSIRDWVDRQLITERGIRGQVLMGEGTSQELDNRAIWPLVDAHLVRTERRRGATWFELAHDRLVEPVRADNEAWRAEHLSLLQRKAALWDQAGRPSGLLLHDQELVDAEAWAAAHEDELEKHERDFRDACWEAQAVIERERKQARRIQQWAIGATIAGILALIALVVAMYFFGRVNQELQLSLSRRLAAESGSHLADRYDLALLLSLAANEAADTVEARASLLAALEYNPRLTAFVPGAGDAVTALAWSGDGRALATGSRNSPPADGAANAGPAGSKTAYTIILWDMRGEQPRREWVLPAPYGEVTALAFSQDGARLAVGNQDGSISLWDDQPGTGRPEEHPLSAYHNQDRINGLAFSADGRWLAAAGKSQVLLWDIESLGSAPASLLPAPESVCSVAFGPGNGSPAGNSLAVGYRDGRISLWEVETRRFTELTGSQGDSVACSLVFSSDGYRLAAARGENLVVWDVAARRPMTLTGHTDMIEAVAFSPDGKQLASGGRDRVVLVWDVATGQPAGPTLAGHGDWVRGVAFSPDGKQLVSGASDGTLILWDLAAHSRLRRTLAGPYKDEVQAVALSTDGRWLASGDISGQVVVWDMATGQSMALPGHQYGVLALAFAPTARPAAAAAAGSPANGSTASALLASGGEDGHVRLWQLTPQLVQVQDLVHNEGQYVSSLAFSPDGKRLVSGSFDRTIKIWNLELDPPSAVTLNDPTGQVRSVVFSHDGRTLVSLDDQGAIVFREAAQGRPRDSISSPPGSAYKLALSPDGKWLAAATLDNTVLLWDLSPPWYAPWQPPGAVITLTQHTYPVSGVAFAPDGRTLVSGSTDPAGTVILWDLATGRMIHRLLGHSEGVNDVAFSPDGRILVDASNDQTVAVWDVSLESWRRKACAIANRNPSAEEWWQYLGQEQGPALCAEGTQETDDQGPTKTGDR